MTRVKTWVIAVGTAILGLILGLLGRRRPGNDDYSGHFAGIDSELEHQRDGIGQERVLTERERDSIERERRVVDRDRELIEELKRRIAEDELA